MFNLHSAAFWLGGGYGCISTVLIHPKYPKCLGVMGKPVIAPIRPLASLCGGWRLSSRPFFTFFYLFQLSIKNIPILFFLLIFRCRMWKPCFRLHVFCIVTEVCKPCLIGLWTWLARLFDGLKFSTCM
jgi:hypothetical protein